MESISFPIVSDVAYVLSCSLLSEDTIFLNQSAFKEDRVLLDSMPELFRKWHLLKSYVYTLGVRKELLTLSLRYKWDKSFFQPFVRWQANPFSCGLYKAVILKDNHPWLEVSFFRGVVSSFRFLCPTPHQQEVLRKFGGF